MRTRQQKNYRRNWFSRIDWEAVGLNGLLAVIIGATIFAVIWVALHPNDKTDSTDSVPDTVAVVDTMVESSPGETKSYSTDFDTTVAGTRVVIKTNRRIKVKYNV